MIHEQSAPIPATDPATDPIIELTDLVVERGGRVAVDIDRLSLAPGVTALVGPNGSGKSTLLHAVAGILPPVRGSVRVAAGQRVAYVLQAQHASEHLLVTAREVVELARAAHRGPFRPLRRADRERARDAMQRLEVADLAGRHLAELSGGQRQRVFVAQGLAQDADVLLLDEPVAGLDLASTQRIRAVIDDERAAGRTIVVATHDLDAAARADHVVMLNGRVVAAGVPADVLVPENLRTMYGGRVLDLGSETFVVDDGVHHDDHEHHHHDHGHHDHGHHDHGHHDHGHHDHT